MACDVHSRQHSLSGGARLKHTSVLIAVVMAFAAMVFESTASANGKQTLSSPTLTNQGRLLLNLEGLLRRTFGSRQVWTTHEGDFVCAGSSCGPLAKYSPYFYVFLSPSASPFVLSEKHFQQGAFGNYPYQILVRGESVACNASQTTFLVAYSDAEGLALGCIHPSR